LERDANIPAQMRIILCRIWVPGGGSNHYSQNVPAIMVYRKVGQLQKQALRLIYLRQWYWLLNSKKLRPTK